MITTVTRQQPVLRACTLALSRVFSTTHSQQPPIESSSKQPDVTSKKPHSEQPEPPKTQAQLDEELRQKLAERAGDGGEAGVEYEDGQPVAMKQSVRENMFRYI